MELAQAEVARSSKEHVRLQQELQRAEIEKSRSNQNPKPQTPNPKRALQGIGGSRPRCCAGMRGGGVGGLMQGGLLIAVCGLRFGLVLSGPFLRLQRTPNFNARLI